MSSISSRRRGATRRTCDAVAVALLELGLGLDVVVDDLLVDVAVVLGQAEVEECAMPGVSQCHGESDLTVLRRLQEFAHIGEILPFPAEVAAPQA